MPVTHLLDTSVFSQPIKDKPAENVLRRWSDLGDASVCISAICLAEVLQGLELRASRKYWRRYDELLRDRYTVHAFDAETAVVFSRLHAEMHRSGKTRPALDLMIAATAVQHDLTIATLNAKDFDGIKGVGVEDWSN